MSPHASRRPSPGTLLALIALVAALAGTADALPGSNQIDKDDLKGHSVSGRAIQQGAVGNHKLKDGAVTDVKITDGSVITPKIANLSVTDPKIAADAVTGPKIAADSVTGADVDESSLGEVPSAASLSYVKRVNLRLEFGDDVELVSNGPISVRARCYRNGTFQTTANVDGIELYARTTEPGSFLNGSNSRRGDLNGNGLVDAESLDPGDPIELSSLSQGPVGLSTAPDESGVGHAVDWGYVLSPDGDFIGVDDSETVLGLRVLGADCAVIGAFQLQG